MRAARANRLAGRAARLRHDGSRGPLARRARRILTTAAEAGDQVAVAALWEAWLRDPRDHTWHYLRRWRTPADVLAAAVDPHRPAASRAAVGAFCRRHGLVPDNTVDAALFFVLTGQTEQYEALDPDGSLLASGYRGASDATRKALRDTMLGLGAVNLVRVIADRPDRVLTEAEAEYLAARLADEGDWDGLWRLVPTVPLVSAVRAARLFGDWRPRDDAGRDLLDRLAAVDPEEIGAVSVVTRIKGMPWQFSFAPDGAELAIRHARGTTIHDPRTGRQLASYPDREQLDVLALGNRAIVHRGGERNGWSITRCTPERPYEELLPRVPGARVEAVPGGFVVATHADLRFGAAGGTWWRTETVGDAHVGERKLVVGMKTADPATGRLVLRVAELYGAAELVLVDADLTVLGRVPHDAHHRGAFCGPEQLLQWWWGKDRAIESWRRDGTSIVRTARTDLDEAYLEPVPLPAANLVAVRRRPGRLAWLDAGTLTEVDGPPGFPAMDTRHLAFSQDGTLAAVVSDNGTEVYDLARCQLVSLVERPLSRMVPADLPTVRTLAERGPSPAVALLRAGLEYRFGADVALGSGAGFAARSDDIVLGGDR